MIEISESKIYRFFGRRKIWQNHRTGFTPKRYHYLDPRATAPAKKMSRGYNQSLEWAKGLSSATGIGVSENLVRRIKYTRSQTLLNKEERRKNIENAFRITTRNTRFEWNGEHHFLLADDVITSGITLGELAKTMRNSFPRSRFSVCTLAFRDY